MQTVTISQLQKNISMLSSAADIIHIQNGTTGENIGTFTPNLGKPKFDIMKYAGSLKNEYTEKYKDIPIEDLIRMGRDSYYKDKKW